MGRGCQDRSSPAPIVMSQSPYTSSMARSRRSTVVEGLVVEFIITVLVGLLDCSWSVPDGEK